MKTPKFFIAAIISLCLAAQAQVFVYDQQSVTDDNLVLTGGIAFFTEQPMGESFTPTLSSVGFVRLYIFNGGETAMPATVYVNLLADSITGPVLSQSEPVSLPGGQVTRSPINLLFSSPVSVTPGVTYYLQPVLQPVAGDNPYADAFTVGSDSYSGGTLFVNGASDSSDDLWFREGIYIVPEPSPSWLVLLGSGVWFYLRNRKGFRLSS
jgi:hypothetical protein